MTNPKPAVRQVNHALHLLLSLLTLGLWVPIWVVDAVVQHNRRQRQA